MAEFARMVVDLLVISSVWMYSPTLDLLALAVIVVLLAVAAATVVGRIVVRVVLPVAVPGVVLATASRGAGRVILALRRARAPSVVVTPSHA